MDRADLKALAEQRRGLRERILAMTDERLLTEYDRVKEAADTILGTPVLRQMSGRSGTVVHYRMVRRECLNRMKRGNR